MPSSRLPWEPPLPAGEKPLSVWWHLPQRQAWRGPRLRERSHVPPGLTLVLPGPGPALSCARPCRVPFRPAPGPVLGFGAAGMVQLVAGTTRPGTPFRLLLTLAVRGARGGRSPSSATSGPSGAVTAEAHTRPVGVREGGSVAQRGQGRSRQHLRAPRAGSRQHRGGTEGPWRTGPRGTAEAPIPGREGPLSRRPERGRGGGAEVGDSAQGAFLGLSPEGPRPRGQVMRGGSSSVPEHLRGPRVGPGRPEGRCGTGEGRRTRGDAGSPHPVLHLGESAG